MTTQLDLRAALHAAGPDGGDGSDLRIGLASSFTPLHLPVFLRAYTRQRRSDAAVTVRTGRYGDLPVAIGDVASKDLDATVVLIEWRDLDPRLGVRESVGAATATDSDLLATARSRSGRITRAIAEAAELAQVVVSLPMTAVSPVYAPGRVGIGGLRMGLDAVLAEALASLSTLPNVTVVRGAAGPDVLDLAAEIRSGAPYPVAVTSALAEQVVHALFPAPAKKGIITDLDDTVWRGLVGEVGPDAVTWDLDAGSHVHGLYQRLLAELAAEGALVAVVSKNDAEVVAAALGRADLLLPADRIFPVLATWGPKSQSVAEVLDAWNVGASDVVFVDDSPLELAEVTRAHPGVTALQFPTLRPDGVWDLLTELRSLFPRRPIGVEDQLRAQSVRATADMAQARRDHTDTRAFLADLDAELELSADVLTVPRPRELVNKTNQFSLDGARYDERAWRELCTAPGAVACAVSYRDRFGPLGTVSVLVGAVVEDVLHVRCWVLSCRAFSRGVEVTLLAAVLRRLNLDRAVVEVRATERNAVARDFLASVGVARGDTVVVDRADLEAREEFGSAGVGFTGSWPVTSDPVTTSEEVESRGH